MISSMSPARAPDTLTGLTQQLDKDARRLTKVHFWDIPLNMPSQSSILSHKLENTDL